jgi:hypothetical protein
MKYFFIILLFSSSAFALEWSELVINESYKLTQKFKLPLAGSETKFLEFIENDVLILKEQIPLGYLNVEVLRFHYIPCPDPESVTEMDIIAVEATDPKKEIGAQLEIGCELNIYLETQDVNTTSFLK